MVLQAALTGGGTQADSASLEELSGACLNQATLKNPLNSEVFFFFLLSQIPLHVRKNRHGLCMAVGVTARVLEPWKLLWRMMAASP